MNERMVGWLGRWMDRWMVGWHTPRGG